MSGHEPLGAMNNFKAENFTYLIIIQSSELFMIVTFTQEIRTYTDVEEKGKIDELFLSSEGGVSAFSQM